jgi:hypothetical protein
MRKRKQGLQTTIDFGKWEVVQNHWGEAWHIHWNHFSPNKAIRKKYGIKTFIDSRELAQAIADRMNADGQPYEEPADE